jgi:7,8-dihydropterin-6-yl-methyl-4-(beta-D-ribofuranosyl)aminobenzene 5'-phosphate synthase
MVTITILVENTARGPSILGEHGLAWWIDTGTHRVLFDTGQGMALIPNAKWLGIDLARADAIVLSHGHFDHVGGLEAALAAAPRAPLFLHPRAVEAKFSGSDPKAGARRISIPFVETESFRRGNRRVVTTADSCEVAPGVWTTGEIPRANDFEDTGGPFSWTQRSPTPTRCSTTRRYICRRRRE